MSDLQLCVQQNSQHKKVLFGSDERVFFANIRNEKDVVSCTIQFSNGFFCIIDTECRESMMKFYEDLSYWDLATNKVSYDSVFSSFDIHFN